MIFLEFELAFASCVSFLVINFSREDDVWILSKDKAPL